MADHVTNTVIDDLVGYRYRLFRVTGIVILYRHQLIALDTAFGVDIGNRLTRTGELHITILRHRAGHGANYGNLDVFCHSDMADSHRDTTGQQRFTLC
ncbi:hypothetical protein D3C80_1556970 [compost metagenome]